MVWDPQAWLLLALTAVRSVLDGVGLPLPGDAALVSALHDRAPASPLLVAALALAAGMGSLAGELLAFFAGRRVGPALIRRGSRRLPTRAAGVARAGAAFLLRHAGWIIVLGRFTAVLRPAVAPLAGVAGVPPRQYVRAAALGTIAWVALITGLVLAADGAARGWLHGGAWALLVVAVVGLTVPLVLGRTAGRGASRALRLLQVMRSVPFTSAFCLSFLAIGVVTGALWHRAERAAWYDQIAYGLPQIEQGRWWTPITGSMIGAEPLHYATFVLVAPLALGLLERRRGSRTAAAYLIVGQLGALFGAFAILSLLARSGWAWPTGLAGQLDAGPSGGYLAVVAGLAATTGEPWRLRLRIGLVAILTVMLIGRGEIADLEHIVAVGAVTVIAVGRRRRPTIREWRLLGCVGLMGLLAAQLLSLATSGPALVDDRFAPLWLDALVEVAALVLLARPLLKGVRLAWWLTLGLAALSVAQSVGLVIAVGRAIDGSASAETTLATGVLWAGLAALLIAGRHAFATTWRVGTTHAQGSIEARERARETLTVTGGGSLSWMATWPEMAYHWVDGGFVPLQQHARVRIALGDPIVEPERLAEALAVFDEAATAEGVVPCVFSATDRSRQVMPRGWTSAWVADDTILDLPFGPLVGKRWGDCRTALNRAARDGIEVRLTTLREEPYHVVEQVREIAQTWAAEKTLPEMGFTLGGVDEALDPQVRVALAQDADGMIHGVLSWLPVLSAGGSVRGWTLDLMRRRDGGFGAAIDLLIVRSAQILGEEGAEFVSLSGSPLAGEPDDDRKRTRLSSVLDRIAALLEPAYGFQSLHDYKRKFQPRYEPLWLLYRDEADLPAIGLGLTRAFLPGATTTDLVRAGLELRR